MGVFETLSAQWRPLAIRIIFGNKTGEEKSLSTQPINWSNVTAEILFKRDA